MFRVFTPEKTWRETVSTFLVASLVARKAPHALYRTAYLHGTSQCQCDGAGTRYCTRKQDPNKHHRSTLRQIVRDRPCDRLTLPAPHQPQATQSINACHAPVTPLLPAIIRPMAKAGTASRVMYPRATEPS